MDKNHVTAAIVCMAALIACLLIPARAADVITTANVTNDPPVASNANLNSGANILLAANRTSEVTGTVTITDPNGCSQITNVTATLFRTNITGGTDAPDNNRNHYTVLCSSLGDCAGGADQTESFNCDFDMYWYADPTAETSLYDATNWTFNATPNDGEQGQSHSDVRDVEILSAISVQTDSISFGSISLGANTGADNKNASIANHGNEAFDIQIKAYGAFDGDGACMACTAGNVNVDYMQYDSAPFNYGVGQDMAAVNQELDLDADRGNDTVQRPEKLTYFGLGFPAGGISGDCSGTIVIVAEPDPFLD